jgi:hypothetical protein
VAQRGGRSGGGAGGAGDSDGPERGVPRHLGAEPRAEIHHYRFDAAFHQTEGSDPRELSFKRIDARTIEQQTRRNGQITVTRRIEMSPDGKAMTFTASGTTGGGQPYANDIRVYEKR